jgi:hypothetical protein
VTFRFKRHIPVKNIQCLKRKSHFEFWTLILCDFWREHGRSQQKY